MVNGLLSFSTATSPREAGKSVDGTRSRRSSPPCALRSGTRTAPTLRLENVSGATRRVREPGALPFLALLPEGPDTIERITRRRIEQREARRLRALNEGGERG